jgi:molybdopterin/thiamine biosynthesis adenylyltransferase/rhodanese-related sulfurtransferase
MAPTYQDLVAAALENVPELTVDELVSLGDTATLIDVREPDEHHLGTIADALLVPRGILEYTVTEKVPDRNAPIVVYCSAGHRSVLAAAVMQQLGYTNVASLKGGFAAWSQAGRASSDSDSLTVEQRARYSRHLILQGVGETGQRKLLEARVLLVGAGGLGSPAALYLAAAGIGTLGIVDGDRVDASNLQRQVLHDVDGIGRLKVETAAERVAALNPDVALEAHPARLTAANALELMTGYDLIVDGSDNFPTRYLINDASLHLGVPVVHGSIFRFEGQVSVFAPFEGPCYRCLFPLPPPPELAPSCAEAGVLGVLPGIIGSLQAMEAIKLVLAIGESLVGRLLTYDALDEHFEKLQIARDPHCAACHDPAAPPALVDYDEACLPAR